MSEDLDEIVDNLREPSAWVRVVFMLGFAVVLHLLIGPLVLILALAQALFLVFTGDDNDNLRNFGRAIISYVVQILEYLTFNSEQQPFPFSDFPTPGARADDENNADPGSSDKQEGKGKNGAATSKDGDATNKDGDATSKDGDARSKPTQKKTAKRKSAAKKTAKKPAKKTSKSSAKKAASSGKGAEGDDGPGADGDKARPESGDTQG